MSKEQRKVSFWARTTAIAAGCLLLSSLVCPLSTDSNKVSAVDITVIGGRTDLVPAEIAFVHEENNNIVSNDAGDCTDEAVVETAKHEPLVRNTSKELFYGLEEDDTPVINRKSYSAISFASRNIVAEPDDEEVEEHEKVEVDVQYVELPKGIEEWREAVVKEALSHVGQIDYVWGGEDLEDGSDCSGFVWAIYDAAGLGDYFGHRRSCQSMFESLERDKYILLQPYDGALPGDIILYHNSEEYMEQHPDRTEYGHCAIYIGNGEIVHMIGKGCVRSKVVFESQREDYLMLRVIVNDDKWKNRKTIDNTEDEVIEEVEEEQKEEKSDSKKKDKKDKNKDKDNGSESDENEGSAVRETHEENETDHSSSEEVIPKESPTKI